MNYPDAKKDLQEAIESFLNINYVVKHRDEMIAKTKDVLGLSKTMDVLNMDITVDMLKESDLYYLLNACLEFYRENYSFINFSEKKLMATKYFDVREIDLITSTYEIPETEESEFYVFHDVTKVDDMQYMIPRMTEEEIVKLVYGGFIKYDKNLQRESEKVVRNNVAYERVKVYAKSKREIKQSMKDGTYRPTALSINILNRDDGSNIEDIPDELLQTHFVYDEESRTLTISKKDRISLIDGMHRLYALMECYSEQNDKEPFHQIMQMNVFFMTVKQAKKYIYQEGQKNPISKEQLQKLDTSNLYSDFVENLVNVGDSYDNLLKDKIGTDNRDITLMNKFTTYGKLTESIADNFEIDPKDVREKRMLTSYLIRFFNELFSIYKDDVADIKKSRKENVRMNPNMIYVYVLIAKHLRGQSNWEEMLELVLNEMDFSINGVFKEVSDKYEISKKNKNILYSIVEKIF